jgi:hypothetical protein
VKTLIVTLFVTLIVTGAAQAHRMTSHDYKQSHWCNWSAASVCAKWRARGGQFICAAGDQSVSCKVQRRGLAPMK